MMPSMPGFGAFVAARRSATLFRERGSSQSIELAVDGYERRSRAAVAAENDLLDVEGHQEQVGRPGKRMIDGSTTAIVIRSHRRPHLRRRRA